MTREEILQAAIEKYGCPAQMDMMIEEMSELTKALLKCRRFCGGFELRNNVLEEMADVQIVLDQMRMIYGSTEEWEQIKVQRLADCLGLTSDEVVPE